MYKKLLYLFIFSILVTPTALCENYVSPENYAVNEADMTDYMSIPAPNRNYSNTKTRKPKEYKNKPPSKMEENIKSKLREIRQKSQEPHHGSLHEIKVNSKYKQNLQNKETEQEEIELDLK